nr:TetR family transcriptional regulator [Rhodococcus opacus]
MTDSLNAIAERAGVGPGTLYRHLPYTRENVLRTRCDDRARQSKTGRAPSL